MRTFLAFDIEGDVKSRVAEITARFRAIDRGVRWVKSENMHVTVYFFGGVDENRIPDLVHVCRKAVEGIEPFALTVQDISAFPSLERARVIWYGILNEGDQLLQVYERVREGLRGTGIVKDIEERPYTPHLTAGRVRHRMERRLVDEIRELHDLSFGSSRVSEMTLFRSVLTPKGAEYEKLALISL